MQLFLTLVHSTGVTTAYSTTPALNVCMLSVVTFIAFPVSKPRIAQEQSKEQKHMVDTALKDGSLFLGTFFDMVKMSSSILAIFI